MYYRCNGQKILIWLTHVSKSNQLSECFTPRLYFEACTRKDSKSGRVDSLWDYSFSHRVTDFNKVNISRKHSKMCCLCLRSISLHSFGQNQLQRRKSVLLLNSISCLMLEICKTVPCWLGDKWNSDEFSFRQAAFQANLSGDRKTVHNNSFLCCVSSD